MKTEETMETDTREALEEALRGAAESIGRAVVLLQRRLLDLNAELDGLKQKGNPWLPMEHWDAGRRNVRSHQVSDEADNICVTLSTLSTAVRQLAEISEWESRK